MRCPATLVIDTPSTSGRHGPTFLSNAREFSEETASDRSGGARSRSCSISAKVNGGVREHRAGRSSDHNIIGESPWVRSRTEEPQQRASDNQRLCIAGCSTRIKQRHPRHNHSSRFSTPKQIPTTQRKRAEMKVLCAVSAIGWPAEVTGSPEGREGDGKPAGPYCIYVGPLDLADKCRLEALYQQVMKRFLIPANKGNGGRRRRIHAGFSPRFSTVDD